MGSLSRSFAGNHSRQTPSLMLRNLALTYAMIAVAVGICGCGSSGSNSAPAPPQTSVVVSVTPSTGSVLLGAMLSFTATVSNATDTTVTWSVNNIPGGSAQLGTITSAGVYTAPADLPTAATVQIAATSSADPTKSASAPVTISSDIAIFVSPATSNAELGSVVNFHASISSNGHPDATIRWTLSGATCPGACGSIDANGNYTAPQILPNPAAVTITVTSVADSSKQNSATVTITSNFTLLVSAPPTMTTGATTAIVATLTPVPGSSPSSSLSWSVTGAGCSGNSCGILSSTTTQSDGASSAANTANYTAPASVPQPGTVIVTVTPLADPTKKAQATIAIQPGGASLNISPITATLAANHRTTLSVTENGVTGTLNWSANGISGGNATLGQICVVGSSPCQSLSSGAALQVDYIAPGALPSPNPVSVTVTSATNASLTASAQITVLNHILVSVLPNSVTLPPLGIQGFTANVLGTNNQSVVWQVEGTDCANGLCGIITPTGAFTAPSAPPTPNAIQIVATSQDDPTQSGAANVIISSGPNILSLHPASVYGGAADGFTITVDGGGFAPSSPGPGAVLLIGGLPRITSCSSANACSAPVSATDVALSGNVSIQIQNPDNTTSNTVSLVVVPPASTETPIALTTAALAATGMDIIVVEPTSAGLDTTDSNLDLNVAALGTYVTSTNTCNLAGNPVPLLRPVSGTISADICLFSQSGLDTSMTYTISGPGDIAVIAKQPDGLGIIHLTLQIPASAVAGERTLFIQNANLDLTAASGALEIR